MQFNNPTRQDQEDFLIRLYFGEKSDYLEMCIDRAYLDFNRTLHGIKNHQGIYKSAKIVMTETLRTFSENKSGFHSGTEFDEWHKNLCIALCKHYADNGFVNYHIGQAQKWVNMAFKYVFTMGEKRLPNYFHVYEFCHIPIDNIIINNLSAFHPPKLTCAWSRMDDYDKYMEFQNWVRECFKGSAPLAVEFFLWQQPSSRTLATLSIKGARVS